MTDEVAYIPFMSEPIGDLSNRMRDIFRLVVEAYLERGAPVGSKMLAGSVSLSPASIRGVMQELEERGLLTHPHTSAGRIPTETGLRLFVDGIMHSALPRRRERAAIEARLSATARSRKRWPRRPRPCRACRPAPAWCWRPRASFALKQLSFVPLAPDRALAVLVGVDGSVENRVVALPRGTNAMALAEVGNYVSARLSGPDAGRGRSAAARRNQRAPRGARPRRRRTGRGGPRRLEHRPGAAPGADRARPGQPHRRTARRRPRARAPLLDELEDRQDIARLLEGAREGQGCRIFIGSENRMFALSGSSVIAAPYRGSDGQVVGVVGVIGPTRLNYARVVPMVDFTAQALTRYMQ